MMDFEAFLAVAQRPDGWAAPGTYDEFVQGFQVFDKEGNGYISVGELRYGMKCIVLLAV